MNRKSLIKITIMFFYITLYSGGCGVGGKKSMDSGVTPLAPSEISATEGELEDSVVIEWNEVADAESYVVYKSIDNREQFKVIAINVKGLTYTDTPVSSGRIFYYKVASVIGTTWSEPGSDVRGFALKGTPKPPENVNIPENKIGEIVIKWEPSINVNTLSYKVLRSEKMYGNYETIASGLTVCTYTDTTAVPDKKYYYQIIAVNSKGDGAPSESISATALQAVPDMPVNIQASDATFGEKVVLTWNAAVNAASYKILRAPDVVIDSTNTPGQFVQIAENITGETFEDRSLGTDESLFHYTVIAVSSGGESMQGVSDTGCIDRDKPAQLNAPSNVRASKGKTNMITVTWNAVDGAFMYTIYRSSSNNGTYTRISDATAPVVSYDDGPGETITKYYYKVSAWSRTPAGITAESSLSITAAEGFANPQIPVTPVASISLNHSTGKITLSWPAADRAKSYNVNESEEADGVYKIMSENQTGLSWTGTTGTEIDTATEYYFKIRAINEGGESELSNSVAGIILAVPSGLTATKVYKINVTYDYTVTWTAVAGATGYELVYDDTHTVTIDDGSVTSKTFNIPSAALSHKFKVRAVDSNINVKGDFSGIITK